MSAVRWATNRSEAAKMNNFYRMQRQFSDILNSDDTKTGDLQDLNERRMRLFNVRKRMWVAHCSLRCACCAF